jgi:hypothetical protein
MLRYSKAIVVEACDLEEAVSTRYGIEINEIRSLLFYDDYMNDCFKTYYFGEDDKYEGYSWQNEENIKTKNLINQFLRETFPNEQEVLIDVSW